MSFPSPDYDWIEAELRKLGAYDQDVIDDDDLDVGNTFQRVADILGPDLTAKLVEKFQGTKVEFPSVRASAFNGTQVAEVIGLEAVVAVAKEISPSRPFKVYIPMGLDMRRRLVREGVYKIWLTGLSTAKIARALGICERTVFRYLAKQREENPHLPRKPSKA